MAFLLHQTIDEAAERLPEQEAFRCRNAGITYGDLAAQTGRLAHLLVEYGVKPGDRVGIRLPRCCESAVAVHAIMKCGAAFVPIDPILPDHGLARVIADCGLRHLISSDVSPAMKGVETVIEVGLAPSTHQQVEEFGTTAIRRLPWEALEAFSSGTPRGVRTTERDLAYLMYTSGSTGRPKGIMHTHRSGLAYAELSVQTYGVGPHDRIGNHSPLHFDMSTFGYFAGPLAGATTVIIPEEHTKLPASLSQLMADERLTIWYSVPSVLIHLLERGALDQRDLTTLRWVKFGGEPLAVKHLKRLISQWPQAQFSNVYGPAEVNQCTWYHLQADLPTGPIPIGRVWENTEALVLDEHDHPVVPGQIGELAVRSATMMLGYWNQPGLTSRSLYRTGDHADLEKVFYRTGDLVRELESGEYVFLGRRDRQIKTRGHRVELDDVEAALADCREVVESAAFAVDDGEGSRVIKAAVIAKPDSKLTERGAMAHARQHLPPYAVPQSIEIRSQFPRTATGKIDRLALQRSAEAERQDPKATGYVS